MVVGGDGNGGDTTAEILGTSSLLGGAVAECAFELSTANASQNALCVIKLSFLQFIPNKKLYTEGWKLQQKILNPFGTC